MTPTALASELRDTERVLESWTQVRPAAATLITRLRAHVTIPPGAPVLDVGAAQGLYVAALRAAGLDAIGVEPFARARAASAVVGRRTNQTIELVDGSAEQLPFADCSFALVLANSVLEHADDPALAVAEAFRTLVPGGGFYFCTTSALCPRQSEIQRFPAFPWYPASLKRRVMDWAVASRPSLVGHTTTPARHWFTPRRVRRLALSAGFSAVYDRWDIRGDGGMGPVAGLLFRTGRRSVPLRRLGDLGLEGSAYLFVK
jgi:SAM-dependent methyltransferase